MAAPPGRAGDPAVPDMPQAACDSDRPRPDSYPEAIRMA